MNQILINPGVIVYDEDRRKVKDRYLSAINKASFLDEREKKNWKLLGSVLTTKQINDAIMLILNEDMRIMKIRHQLEVIKPIK